MTKEKDTKKEFLQALIKAQKEIGKIYKDKINPHFKSKYVPLNSILEEIKPALNDNNFFLTQKICTEADQEVLKTEITHVNGECLSSCAPLNIADKNNPQKYGSAITYMRRYSLTSLLGLEEDDDDGQRASQGNGGYQKPQPISKINNQQLEQLQSLLEGAGKDKIEFCQSMKLNALSDLPQSKFDVVCKRLKEIADGNN